MTPLRPTTGSPPRTPRPRRFRRLAAVPRARFLAGLSLAILTAMASLFLACPRPRSPGRELGGSAVWMARKWLDPKLGEAEIIAMLDELRTAEIRYLFVHLCPMDASGKLPPFSAPGLARLQRLAAEEHPGAAVIPWIGGVAGKNADLSDRNQMDAFIAEAARLTRDLGCPGVHLNLEPIESGDPLYLEILERMRDAIGQGRFISASVFPPTAEGLASRGKSWDPDYFREVAKRVDQLALMSYDTGARSPEEYVALMDRWTELATAIALDAGGPGVLMGVPTYDERTSLHHPGVENPRNAIKGVAAARDRIGPQARVLEGLALYAHWTTGPEEWLAYRENWIKSVQPSGGRP